MQKKRLLPLLTILISFLLLPSLVFAQKETKNIEVKQGEVINRDFFAAGETVTISGVVNGDVYAAGGNVSVDGKINGDLLVGAGMVTLLGEVSDDVRVGGGNVLINGFIGKNLTVGGGNVTISSEAEIGGSLLAFSGNLDIRGPIGADANIYAGRALIASQIGGDLRGSIEELVLTAEAQILGDLEYESQKKAEIDEKAVVAGKITHTPSKAKVLRPEKLKIPSAVSGIGRTIKLYLKFTSFVISLLLGLLFIYFFPKRAQGMVKILESRLWGSLGIGILTLILFPIGIIFLAISLIGIPFILLVVPLFVLLVYFSRLFTALFVGRKIVSKSQGWALFAGLVIYYVLRLIPMVNPIIGFVFITLGLGGFILDQKSLRRTTTRKSKVVKGA